MNKKDQKKIVQMDEQTWRIIDGFGDSSVYSYLICGSERAVLVDTGMGTTDFKRITDELTPLPVSVINTHGHIDHISGNHAYQTAYLHPADEAIFREHNSKEFRVTVVKGLLAAAKMPAWLIGMPGLKGMFAKLTTIPARENRRPLSDGMRFDLGGRTLEVIATPGHTPGSICLLDIERRQLFSGDICCAQGVLLMFDHSCPVGTFKESILRLKAESPRYTWNWPAHHELPLDHSWMDDYLGCIERILSGAPADDHASSPLGSGAIMKYGRIALSYREDRL